MVPSLSICGIKVINLNYLFNDIEFLVQNDIHKFSVQNKTKIIKSFIILRLCNVVFDTIKKNKNCKLVFYINKSNTLSVLHDYYNFMSSIFLKICNILSINFLIDNLSIDELQCLLSSESGECKEVRARIRYLLGRNKPQPNIDKLIKLFKKYSITQTESMFTDLNSKLCLFLT